MAGKIILLNGVSSAGKTTLARQIQKQSEVVFFLLSIDDFISMVGEKAISDDFLGVVQQAGINMTKTACLFCGLGKNVIIDTVLIHDGTGLYDIFCRELEKMGVLFANVVCDAQIIKSREKERGDRDIGQASWQLEQLINDACYDITIDTSKESVENNAESILKLFSDSVISYGLKR